MKNHTHVCADCEAIFACDGACEISRLCQGCAEYREAVETNERETAIEEQQVYRRFGDDDSPIRFR